MHSYLKVFFTVFLGFSFTSSFSALSAQVVTFEPSFATEFDSLLITFDATQGNGGLADFSGDVYLHTGVITTKSNSDTDWQYVPNSWDQYPEKVKASFIGDNKWQFTYKPSIREFFGITDENERVRKVAMLFRGTNTGSGDPVAVGRGEGDSDIFIELTTGDVNAKFLNPVTDGMEILDRTNSLEIVGIGSVNTGTLSLSLLKNSEQVATVTDDTLRYSFNPTSEESDVRFDLIASSTSGMADTASFFLTIKDGDGDLLDRPSGLKDGITYTSSTSALLSLYAPNKNYVYVIGDFNDWRPSADYLMNKEVKGDSVWFWTEITGLTPGQEYGFQYLVDNSIRIADPYSELVLDPFNDTFIPDEVYPDLKPYPLGLTTEYVGVLQPGKPEYQWQTTNYQAPPQDELVIYELLIRDFFETPSYTNLIDTLDYLDNLGVNAIELMPINEFEGNISWGYNPSFHFALDKYYGTQDEFKRFVDEAHKRGIAVILDVVLNHAFGQNPLVRLWNDDNYGAPTEQNPYYNRSARHDFNVGYDMNHESPVSRAYTKRVIQYWLDEYKVDGYRFDLSKGFTQVNTLGDVGRWNQYDQSRVDIWLEYASFMRNVNPDSYIILEHFAEDSEERVLSDNGMLLWGNMNHGYNEASMGYNSNLNGVLAQFRGFNDRHLIGYMESHDEQWLMFKNIMFGNRNLDIGYDIRTFPTALDRMELVGAFFYTLPGPKMLWQFGELGYGYGDSGEQCLREDAACDQVPTPSVGRTDPKPIRWDYYDDPDRKDLYDAWSAMINLRRSSPAFTQPSSTFYDLDGTIKYIRLRHPDTDVVIIGNFSVNNTNQTFDFPVDGTWYDFFGESEITVSGGSHSFDMVPGEYRIFTTRQFTIGTNSEYDREDDTPTTFKLHQNYPNPFNPSTSIMFDVAETGVVTLEVFDITGRKVADLVNGVRTQGSHTVTFNASELSSGIYFARLTAGGTVQTQKMMLLK